MHKDKNGLGLKTIFEIILLLTLIIGIIGYIWVNQSPKSSESTKKTTSLAEKIDNFDDCVSAGNEISYNDYPETCTDNANARFIKEYPFEGYEPDTDYLRWKKFEHNNIEFLLPPHWSKDNYVSKGFDQTYEEAVKARDQNPSYISSDFTRPAHHHLGDLKSGYRLKIISNSSTENRSKENRYKDLIEYFRSPKKSFCSEGTYELFEIDQQPAIVSNIKCSTTIPAIRGYVETDDKSYIFELRSTNSLNYDVKKFLKDILHSIKFK